MFARAILTLTLAATALASPTILARSVGSCSAGPVQCCNQVQPAGSPAASNALGNLIDVPIQDVNTPIGLSCSPINVLALGGTNCASTPVCCDQNYQNGLVNINCLPAVTQLP
ncbi:hydrophobin [Phlebiopsis gigantea 11061_1 CR5-6]|uniref:Hydrophobin n=1 Tax=Phlebiopsis gigantea (strain 11061_1 CR5-6) TaxID=745531 RepID=A0A0C3P9A3_PHLG1|nr:hydrophobin [Phlebiopsis gigantea 11061_1 CR5-6]